MVKKQVPQNPEWRIIQAKNYLDYLDSMMYEGRNIGEMDFLRSIKEQVGFNRPLSDKQLDKLREIYRRAAGDI